MNEIIPTRVRPIEILLVEDNPGDVRRSVEEFWLSVVKLPANS